MEEKNERIQKLKLNFTADDHKRLSKINDSVFYNYKKKREVFTAESNFMKHRENLLMNRSINVRETNVKHMNNFQKFKKNRYDLWQSGITTLPGSKLGIKQNESTKSYQEKETFLDKSRYESRRNSDAVSNSSRLTDQDKKKDHKNITNKQAKHLSGLAKKSQNSNRPISKKITKK